MMKTPHEVLLLALGLSLAACGSASPTAAQIRQGSAASPGTSPSSSVQATQSPGLSGAGTALHPAISGSTAPAVSRPGRGTVARAAASSAPVAVPGAWKLAVFYTPVQSYHTGAPQAVTGCPPAPPGCSHGSAALGSYPGDFLQAVRDNGTGRLTGGRYAGRFLSYDSASGYSIDTANTDDSGTPVKPFVSAAADEGIPLGTSFRVRDCGVDDSDGSRIDPGVCARLMAASWVVVERSGEPAGSRELDLYIGEEDRPDFENVEPLLVSTAGARTTLQ